MSYSLDLHNKSETLLFFEQNVIVLPYASFRIRHCRTVYTKLTNVLPNVNGALTYFNTLYSIIFDTENQCQNFPLNPAAYHIATTNFTPHIRYFALSLNAENKHLFLFRKYFSHKDYPNSLNFRP